MRYRALLFPSLPHAIPDVKNKPDENEHSIKRCSIISSLPNKICQVFDNGEAFVKVEGDTQEIYRTKEN
jgi:hypothetical protein